MVDYSKWDHIGSSDDDDDDHEKSKSDLRRAKPQVKADFLPCPTSECQCRALQIEADHRGLPSFPSTSPR